MKWPLLAPEAILLLPYVVRSDRLNCKESGVPSLWISTPISLGTPAQPPRGQCLPSAFSNPLSEQRKVWTRHWHLGEDGLRAFILNEMIVAVSNKNHFAGALIHHFIFPHTVQDREQFVDEKTGPRQGKWLYGGPTWSWGVNPDASGSRTSVLFTVPPWVSPLPCPHAQVQGLSVNSSQLHLRPPQLLLPNSPINTSSPGTSDIIQFALNAVSYDSPQPPGINWSTF